VPLEFVSKTGLGLLKTVSRYGEPLQERKLTVAEMQHGSTATTARTIASCARSPTGCAAPCGFYYNLSATACPQSVPPTHADAGKERMDFCIGNLKGTTSTTDFIEFIAQDDPCRRVTPAR
jgi:hypothetical protein